MIHVLVFGSRGMLGQMLMRVLARDRQCHADGTHRRDRADPFFFDAEQGADGVRVLLSRRPRYDYLINALGMIRARIDPSDAGLVQQAIAANAVFPHVLAAAAADAGAKLIHVSTDCVFSGRNASYDEEAPHDCTDVYGKTKSLGEVFGPGALTIRCSLIGPDPSGGRGLLEWFLTQPQGTTVPGFTDHLWNGVTTLQFAQLCVRIMREERFDRVRQESAVHHFCPTLPVSKYALLERMRVVYGRRVAVVPRRGGPEPVRRILTTRYEGLQPLASPRTDIAEALKALVALQEFQPEVVVR